MSNLFKTSIALLLASCMSMSTAYAKQVKVTIGDGTNSSYYVPYGNYDKNSTTQTIYTQAELGSVAGPIKSIAFDVAAKSSHATTSLKIYIGKSSTTTFASEADYRDVSGMTLVYDGTPTLGKALGWEEIELQTPYQYDGKSNLVIVIGRQASSWNSSLQYSTTNSTNQCLRRGNDNMPETGDPTDTSISYKWMSYRPNIQLLIGEDELVVKDGITYQIKDGEAFVKSCLTTQSGAVTVQSKVTSEGTTYDVKRIVDEAFANCSKLTSITIPTSVTSIGTGAFQNCTSLTAVNLPTSITEIGVNMFAGCSGLSNINIPNTITNIDEGAFSGCSAATSIKIPASVTEIKNDAFKGCTAVTTISFSDCESPITLGATTVEGKSSYYYPGIFEDCPVETVYLGRDVTYTSASYRSPFKSKTTLTKITLGPKITTLSENLFYGCTSVTELTIPANIVTVKESALYRLSGLKELTIEDSDTALDLPTDASLYGMFKSSGIEKLYLGRNVNFCTENRYTGAFYACSNLAEVTIGKKVTELGDNMFYNCTYLKTVYNKSNYFTVTAGDEGNGYVAYYADFAMNGDTFAQTGDFLYYEKNGTKTIYKYVGTKTDVVVPAGYLLETSLFIGHEDLTSITFSQGLKRIPRACMERCTSLTSVTIPNSVEEIDDYALFGCSSLTSIVLPSGLKRLGAHSLQMCSALTEVNIPSGITALEDFCLSRTALTSFDVPANVKRIEAGVFHWCRSLTEVSLPDELEYIGPFSFKYCSELEEIEIPAKVDSVSLHAFYYCPKLKKVNLHEGLKRIGEYGFYYCGITEINLPSTLQSIGQYGLAVNDFSHLELPAALTDLRAAALYGNSNLEAIVIPNGITELSDRLLESCSKLNDITLPEGLTTLGRRSLYGVPGKHIHWPSTLTVIGYQALGGSYTYGMHVIPATVTDINTIAFYSIEDGNKYFCFSEKMLPADVFKHQVLLRSTLYVRPELLAQYQASELGTMFGRILPLGDTNEDGILSIADITEEVKFKNESRPLDIVNGMGNHDTNGDGYFDDNDVRHLEQMLLTPKMTTSAKELKLLDETAEFKTATEPSENCLLLPSGGCFDYDGPLALNLVNHLRLEACLEGLWKSGYEHLSMDDYHIYKWSTDLERSARIRAIESYYTRFHDRLNGGGWGSLIFNGNSTSSECLAFYSSMIGQMNNYYGEKNAWMTKGPGETGHYTSMITPYYYYVGFGGYDGTGCMHMSSSLKAGSETDFLPPTGYQRFYVDVKKSYIVRYEWLGIKNGIRQDSNNGTYTMNDTEYMTLRFSPIMMFYNSIKEQRGFYMTDENMTYTSSDPEVAEASQDTPGQIIGKKPGTAIITASNGEQSSQVTVTVTCEHTFDYSEPDENLKIQAICTKCGEEQEASIPTSFWVFFRTGNNYSSSIRSEYFVGEEIGVSCSFDNGTDPYTKLIVECDRPDLLDTPYHFENSSYWKVMGAGDVTVTVRPLYNQNRYRRYKLHLVDSSQQSDAAPHPQDDAEVIIERQPQTTADMQIMLDHYPMSGISGNADIHKSDCAKATR